MDFSIITFTMGRKFYLHKTIASLKSQTSKFKGQIHHHIFFQGIPVDSDSKLVLNENNPSNYHPIIHQWTENFGISEGTNRAINEITTDYVLKLDDDIELISNNFFEHLQEILLFEPNAFISPFPIGLIVWCGGPKPISYSVKYSNKTDTYYTFRKVDVTGGGCRVAPTQTLKRLLPLENDLNHSASGSDDNQLTKLCNRLGIPIYYIENAIAFEHQESCLGQRERLREYYKYRNDKEIIYPYPRALQIKLHLRELIKLLGCRKLLDFLDKIRGRSSFSGSAHRI